MYAKMCILFLIKLYVYVAMSVIIHECAHFFTAKIMKFDNVKLYLGSRYFWGITIRNIFVSPILISGSVSFGEKTLKHVDKRGIVMFYLVGGISNLTMFILGIAVNNCLLSFVNMIMMIFSLVPIKFLNNDISELCEVLAKYKR